MTRRQLLELVLATSAVALPSGFALADAPVEMDGLGSGRYASMRAVLEKTIFRVDVVDLEVRLDQGTAAKLEPLVKQHKYSGDIADKVVTATLDASDAYAAQKFLRDFGKDDFVHGVQHEVGRAYQAHLIDKEEYSRVYWGVPDWFAFLGKRGVKKGDRLYERGTGSGTHSVYVDKNGNKKMDVTLPGAAHVRTLLATYLHPGGDLREPLIRSLFDG